MARYKKSRHCPPAWDWQKATVTPRIVREVQNRRSGEGVSRGHADERNICFLGNNIDKLSWKYY